MTLPHYRPALHEELQEPEITNPEHKCLCGPFNCNMCAAASYLDRVTLGGDRVTGCQMRHDSGTHGDCTDGIPGNEGTNITDAATALAKHGRHLGIERHASIGAVFHALQYVPVILHGDYDRVPLGLKGDREFQGLHSVLLNEHDASQHRTLVYDSLDDGRTDVPNGHKAPQGPVWWPDDVVTEYAEKFPGGIVFGYEDVVTGVWTTAPIVNVRSAPRRAPGNVIHQLHNHEYRDRGDVVLGERIGGDARWYRIWLPGVERVGFVHASVVRLSQHGI